MVESNKHLYLTRTDSPTQQDTFFNGKLYPPTHLCQERPFGSTFLENRDCPVT